MSLYKKFLKYCGTIFTVLILSACAHGPSQIPIGRLSATDKIGVISIAADYARLGHVGMTLFNNEHYYVPLGDFGLDSKIETDTLDSLKGSSVKVVSVTYDRNTLLRTYNTHDLDSSMLIKPLWFKSDLSIIRDDLLGIAKKNNVGYLVVVTKAVCPDTFGQSNQNLNGFGLYNGRYASGRIFGGHANNVTMAYMCIEASLLDSITGDVIATRRVTPTGTEKGAAPALAVAYWTKSLSDIPRDQQDHIVGAFRKMSAAVVPTIAALLNISVNSQSLQ